MISEEQNTKQNEETSNCDDNASLSLSSSLPKCPTKIECVTSVQMLVIILCFMNLYALCSHVVFQPMLNHDDLVNIDAYNSIRKELTFMRYVSFDGFFDDPLSYKDGNYISKSLRSFDFVT